MPAHTVKERKKRRVRKKDQAAKKARKRSRGR